MEDENSCSFELVWPLPRGAYVRCASNLIMSGRVVRCDFGGAFKRKAWWVKVQLRPGFEAVYLADDWEVIHPLELLAREAP